MRVFIGIHLPSEIKDAIEIETDKVLSKTLSYKKVFKETYHLTLKFIGEMEISDIVTLDKILADSLKDVKSFDIVLKDFGYFQKDNQYILWMGARQGAGYLKELRQRIEHTITDIFQVPKSEFNPHITLARKVIIKDLGLLNKVKSAKYAFRIDEVVIFYSHRIEDVLTYTPLSTIKL